MKKFIRRWLGIDRDYRRLEKVNSDNFNLLIEAIDESFGLKEKDKSIRGRISSIIFRKIYKFSEDYANKVDNTIFEELKK